MGSETVVMSDLRFYLGCVYENFPLSLALRPPLSQIFV